MPFAILFVGTTIEGRLTDVLGSPGAAQAIPQPIFYLPVTIINTIQYYVN